MNKLSYNSESGTMHFDHQLVAHMRLGHDGAVKSILQKYRYLYSFVDDSDQTLLHVAAKYGNAEIARYLIQCGCKVDAQDKLGITPLMLAVTDAKDDATVAVLLEANASIHLADHVRKSSALRKVIKSSQTWLENLSAGTFQRTKYYRILRLFFSRVREEFHVDKELMAERLREAHCPLALVMFMNDAVVTDYLLEVGFPLNEFIRNWSTLHIAVLLGDVENVMVLLNNGADVDDLDNQRQSPLFLYDTCSDGSCDQLRILEALASRGASLTVPRSNGVTLMEYFFTYGKKNTLLTLVETNSDELKKSTPEGRTPLHFLIQNKSKDAETAMELLLTSTKVDVDARDVEGKTALIDAVNECLLEKVKFLASFGASVNLIDIFDKTNLFDKLTSPDGYHAKYAKIVDLLIHRGNSPTDCDKSKSEDTFLIHKDKSFGLAKLMLKHLVLDEASGGGIDEATFMKIESKKELQEYYELCKTQLQDMRTTIVYGTITLYKLLSESEEKVTLYARNLDFVEKFEEFMEDKSVKSFYYFDFLRKRIDRAIETAVLRRKASYLVCEISQLYLDPNHDIFYRISKCLSDKDLHNLLKV